MVEHSSSFKNLKIAFYVHLSINVAFIAGLIYFAGERARQMDINTGRIDYLEKQGSAGTHTRLMYLENRVINNIMGIDGPSPTRKR